MKPNASPSSKGSRRRKKQPSYKVWHFALAVPAIAVVLQVMLGSLKPLTKEYNPYQTRYASSVNRYFHQHYNRKDKLDPEQQGLPEIEILPLKLRGEMTGPLLASVLKEYFPQSTDEQAANLRDTLPPGNNPRMIVILPKDQDKQVF